MKEKYYKDSEDLHMVHIQNIAYAADKIYDHTPLKILDIATGSNGLNPCIVRTLGDWNINFELVLSDISPTWLSGGYENLENVLTDLELKKVKCVLADSTDLRKNLTDIPLWNLQITKPLENILDDPHFYRFLRTGYNYGKRNVGFMNNSFDMVIGVCPYENINKADYSYAIKESARVLKIGGYHIISDMHVEKINPDIERTESALRRANIKSIDITKSKIDEVMTPIAWYSAIYQYLTEDRFPEQTLQNGDIVKMSVLIHQKIN